MEENLLWLLADMAARLRRAERENAKLREAVGLPEGMPVELLARRVADAPDGEHPVTAPAATAAPSR